MTTEEDTLYTKLSIEERCIHKLWKARLSGYEEAIQSFGKLDEKSQDWNKYIGIVKKFVIDSNAVAQEKGLEATLVFVENCAIAGRTAGDIMTGLVTKCYGAPKSKTRDIALQITLMLIEIEKQDVVIEELIKGMDHKFPKIVTTCIKAVTQSIKNFGLKVLNIKPILKKLQSILEVKDKSVRDEAKLLALELFSWIGPTSVKTYLANLKPLQIQELDAEYEKIKSVKPQIMRYLRSQQEHVAKMEEAITTNGDAVLDEIATVIDDPEEHIDPVNILCQLNKDFYEKLESKKWQERKEAIDMLEGILSKAPKLEYGEYGDLVRALKKIITKDTNVIIVGIAAKCITMLANGLKKRFEIYGSACLPALLEKFKEKKTNVVLPLRDAIDAIYLNMTLDSILDDILSALNNKNPSVRAESVSFLTRCFKKCTPKILNKHLLSNFAPALIKTLNESDPTVRDNSAEALGTAMKVISEKHILPFLTGVDAIKLAKIKEASEKAIITAKSTTAVIKSVNDVSNNEKKKVVSVINKNTTKKNHTVGNNKTATKNKDGRKKLNAFSEIDNEKNISDDELEEIALTFCSSEIINGMTDANWKTRLFNVQKFAQTIDQTESLPISSQVLIRLLNKKPGIRDNNVQVQKLRLKCLKTIIEKFPVSNTCMSYCLHDVSSLLGDNKNSNLVGEILTIFAESTRLDLVSTLVLEYAFTVQKNPKVQIDILNWLSCAIQEFGFITEPKSLMQNVKKALGASNLQVRMAVISLLGVIYLYMGPQLSLFFENEKPTLVQQINAEFEKYQGKVPPKPTRGKKSKSSAEFLEGTSDDEKSAFQVNISDIVPRVDITPQITDALINAFSDKDWKVRSDAITKLHNIIIEAKFITHELGEAREALKNRINDSNARLGSNAINLIELISKAMGSSFKNYIKLYLPGVLNSLGDSKIFKCQSARQCMNTWADICGYREFFGNDIFLTAFNNNSVTLRTELWTWLAEHLPLMPLKITPADELKSLLPVLYSSLEDRNANVRIASEKAVLGFMIHLGYATLYGACEKLKPMSVKICREKLDRERPNLPIVVPIEKLNVKSSILTDSSVKSKGLNMHPKISSKVHKENVYHRASAITAKKNEDVDNGVLFQQNNLKHQRDIDEHKLKTLKWNFTTPRDEFVEQLKEQMMTAGINKVLIKYMFDSDFIYHLKAIYILSEDLNTKKDDNLALINNLDLILKWMTLRFFDTNPSVLLKGLDYLQNTFNILIEKKYILHDTEIQSFVPYLVTKLGDSKDTVRSTVRAILNQIAFLFPCTKLFQYIMDGLKSKNSRQRSECLEHLTSMIENYGTSICQPSITVALKEIAKSIGDRDNSVRMSALNCFVAVYFLHGEALFKLIGNVSEKNMDLLKERLKRAVKNRSVPVYNIQPTNKIALLPVEQEPDTEETIHNDNSDDEQYNATYHVSNHEQSLLLNSNNSPSRLSSISNQVESTTIARHSSSFEIGFRNVNDKPQRTRFSLDEKLLQELDAEVITKPVLILKPYTWESDVDEKIIPEKFHVSPNYNPSSKPNINMSPFTRSTIIQNHRTQLNSVDSIQQFESVQMMIKHVSSQNTKTLKLATITISNMLSTPQRRPQLFEDGILLSLFHAIIEQLNILCVSFHNIIDFMERSNIIFTLCLNCFKYQEIKILLNEEILSSLLSKLVFLLSMNKQRNTSDTINFQRCVNSILMNLLNPPTPLTPLICALLSILYCTVKYPHNYTSHYKELVMKCIWKLVKDFHMWDSNETHLDVVLAKIYEFLKEFDFKYWKNQSCNNPLKTFKTVLYTVVKAHSDKVLDCLASSEYSENSDMVVYIRQLLKHLNSQHMNTK